MRPFGRTDFAAAFAPGTIFRWPDGGHVRVRHVVVGDLVVSSGQIVACDPSNLTHASETIPFVRAAPPGRYPVILCLTAQYDDDTRGEVACAMIRFTDTPPTTWELAVRAGEDVTTLPLGRFFGYGVDAGIGCFIDTAMVQALAQQDDDDVYRQRVLGELYTRDEYRRGASIVIDQHTGGNVIVFYSGYGDGAYASYWGVGAAGEVCCLVTDFAILVESVRGQATFRVGKWMGSTIVHPDLRRIGLTVRLLPGDAPTDNRLRMEIEGGSCKAVIVNNGKAYSSDRLPYRVMEGVGRYDFRFDAPLQPDAQITLEYGLGMQALERVAL